MKQHVAVVAGHDMPITSKHAAKAGKRPAGVVIGPRSKRSRTISTAGTCLSVCLYVGFCLRITFWAHACLITQVFVCPYSGLSVCVHL